MARARNIKPSLFKNEILGVEDPLLTILFQSLWCLADREGRLEDRPLRIKAETFPYRDGLDINRYLTDLARLGFILRYEADGLKVIQIVNFLKHQNPHNTEKASVLPDYSMKTSTCEITVNPPLNNGIATADSFNPLTDSFNLKPDSGIPNTDSPNPDIPKPEKQSVGQKQSDVVEKVFSYWQEVMNSPRSVLDKDRTNIITKALKTYSPADLCRAIRGCSKSPYHMGQNEQKTKYNGLGLILRNAEKIDRFIELDTSPPVAANETLEQRNARITAEILGDSQHDDGMTLEMEEL